MEYLSKSYEIHKRLFYITSKTPSCQKKLFFLTRKPMKKMGSLAASMIPGAYYLLLAASYTLMQVSKGMDGIVSRGFDAGLSIGLLIVALIGLSWYHMKILTKHENEIENRQKTIDKLANDKDQRTEDLHKLVVDQLSVSKDQVQTNKELREMIKGVVNLMKRSELK